MTKKEVKVSREFLERFFRTGKQQYRMKKGVDEDDRLLSWSYDMKNDMFIFLFGKDGDSELTPAEDFYPELDVFY